jgi:hypothetical protein
LPVELYSSVVLLRSFWVAVEMMAEMQPHWIPDFRRRPQDQLTDLNIDSKKI